MKQLISFLLCGLMAVSIFGCSSSNDSKENKTAGADYAPKSNEIKIKDIEWKVAPGIVDGESVLMFSYKNKSDYTIAECSVVFSKKTDTTQEQMNSAFAQFKEDYEADEEDMEDITIEVLDPLFAEPGESVKDYPCYINGTGWVATSMDQYNLMEPKSIELCFIGKDNRVYKEEYDFKNKAYGLDANDSKKIYSWSSTKIAKMLPEPKVPAVMIDEDKKDEYFVYCYSVKQKDFENYKEEVKEKGFTEDVEYDDEQDYSAKNKDGYELDVSYNSTQERMSIAIEKGK